MKSFGKTDRGLSKQNNEDSFFLRSPVGMFDTLMIVADGVGGASYGEVASKLAVDSIANTVSKSTMSRPGFLLSQAVSLANLKVRREMEIKASRQMGTTLIIAGVIGNRVYAANIGDSRLYQIHTEDGNITKVTKDHSFAEEMVRKGLISRDSAIYKEKEHVITRAVGMSSEVSADLYDFKVFAGDFLLLCSDGLYNMVPEKEMMRIVLTHRDNPEAAVNALIDMANLNGGRDNITAVLYGYEEVSHA